MGSLLKCEVSRWGIVGGVVDVLVVVDGDDYEKKRSAKGLTLCR